MLSGKVLDISSIGYSASRIRWSFKYGTVSLNQVLRMAMSLCKIEVKTPSCCKIQHWNKLFWKNDLSKSVTFHYSGIGNGIEFPQNQNRDPNVCHNQALGKVLPQKNDLSKSVPFSLIRYWEWYRVFAI